MKWVKASVWKVVEIGGMIFHMILFNGIWVGIQEWLQAQQASNGAVASMTCMESRHGMNAPNHVGCSTTIEMSDKVKMAAQLFEYEKQTIYWSSYGCRGYSANYFFNFHGKKAEFYCKSFIKFINTLVSSYGTNSAALRCIWRQHGSIAKAVCWAVLLQSFKCKKRRKKKWFHGENGMG